MIIRASPSKGLLEIRERLRVSRVEEQNLARIFGRLPVELLVHLHPGLLGLDVGQAEGVERLLVLGGDVVVLRLVVPEVYRSTGVLISSK